MSYEFEVKIPKNLLPKELNLKEENILVIAIIEKDDNGLWPPYFEEWDYVSSLKIYKQEIYYMSEDDEDIKLQEFILEKYKKHTEDYY